MPTFLDAAYQILIATDRPMSAEEITRQALDRGLLETKGETPAATMSARLYMDIKEKGAASRFIQVGRNLFTTISTTNGQQRPQFEAAAQPKIKPKSARKSPQLPHATSAHQILDIEIASIKAFLGGQSPHPPTSEKLCDWVTMCYTFGLFSEGVELFNFVEPLEVNEWYYLRTKKMARLCRIHQENHS
ncbi:MAG: winged helix-turn-helix domain-containing protein [Bellilinea sp.]|jgi:hypothetical protein